MEATPNVLDPLLVEKIHAMMAEQPALTEDQLDALCDVLAQVRIQAGR